MWVVLDEDGEEGCTGPKGPVRIETPGRAQARMVYVVAPARKGR